jgi:hypothetical protein
MYADRHPRRRREVRRIRRRFLHRGPYLDVDADLSITYEDDSAASPTDEDPAGAVSVERPGDSPDSAAVGSGGSA